LTSEVARHQGKSKQEDNARFKFAKEHNLPLNAQSAPNLNVVRESTYSTQLLQAENERRNLQAAYDAAKNAPDPFSNPEVQKDERIIKLREKISELNEKRNALLTRDTPERTEVKQVEAQLKPLEEELAKAPQEVLAAMKARADAAAAHEKSLVGSYAKQHGITTTQMKYQIELAARTQEVETDKQSLNTVLQRQQEFTASSADTGSDVSVSN